MRRAIKLTGRKDIPLNSFNVKPALEGGSIEFDVVGDKVFSRMEPSARIYLQLTENKMTETLCFGTVGAPSSPNVPEFPGFRAPSAQLRVVSTDPSHIGLVLGSTSRWTLKMQSGDDEQSTGRGILLFQPKDIKPRTWKLDIRDDEHPVLYVDDSIPEPTDWARRDSVFRTTVMPTVVERIMHHLLANVDIRDYPWVEEWFAWADSLVPETPRPINGDEGERDAWVDILVDEFCRQHRFHDQLLSSLDRGPNQ